MVRKTHPRFRVLRLTMGVKAMKPGLSDSEIHAVREGIRRKYTQVAAQADAGGSFQYPTGR